MERFLEKLFSFMPFWIGWRDVRYYHDHVSIEFYTRHSRSIINYSFNLADISETEILGLAHDVKKVLTKEIHDVEKNNEN